ncbi:MAG: ABC transporter ATP-binding protein [Polyangiaceae bacterium]|nr:ABC transporter ATP-binding protein [Polyangiaceae bacterium]
MADEDAKRRIEERIAEAARAAARDGKRAPIAVDPVVRAGSVEAAGDGDPATATGAPPGARSDGGVPPILECTHVSHRYPRQTGGFQLVLNDIHLRVPQREFISVVGPSGCGKSTLLRLVLGSELPWQGSVTASGVAVDHPRRDRGIVFQRYSLFPHLTVLQNVIFGLELDGTWLLQKWLTWPIYRRTHYRRQVEQGMAYLRTVKLDEHANKYPQQLSGGMQQRVAIAQALIMKPRILLMDEPFGALDPGTREALQLTIVEAFAEQGITVFFVTHDLEEAVFVGNRLLVLSQFWTHDDGSSGEGAKVVLDVRCPKSTSVDVKASSEFQELIQRVRRDGFDPNHQQPVRTFDLSAAAPG